MLLFMFFVFHFEDVIIAYSVLADDLQEGHLVSAVDENLIIDWLFFASFVLVLARTSYFTISTMLVINYFHAYCLN